MPLDIPLAANVTRLETHIDVENPPSIADDFSQGYQHPPNICGQKKRQCSGTLDLTLRTL
jgi:hypothetical protein